MSLSEYIVRRMAELDDLAFRDDLSSRTDAEQLPLTA
jgi:hypothetical protein